MNFDIAVVGATSIAGENLLAALEERAFPVGKVYVLADRDEAGTRLQFNSSYLKTEDLDVFDFSQVQIAWFCTPESVSAAYVPRATEAGCTVIDTSTQFRNQADVPLVVPEVNSQAIAQYKHRNILAAPACSTVQMAIALKPIYDAVGIERINVATYQSVSTGGKAAIEELAGQTVALLSGKAIENKVYNKQIAFNAIPQVGSLTDNGYTQAEMQSIWEMRKLFADENLQVNPSHVFIPVFHGHSQAVHIETREKISASQARALLEQAPGIELIDDQLEADYPTPVGDAAGADTVYVGRVREDISHTRGLDLWIVADNIRKGLALNAISIAETLIKDYI